MLRACGRCVVTVARSRYRRRSGRCDPPGSRRRPSRWPRFRPDCPWRCRRPPPPAPERVVDTVADHGGGDATRGAPRRWRRACSPASRRTGCARAQSAGADSAGWCRPVTGEQHDVFDPGAPEAANGAGRLRAVDGRPARCRPRRCRRSPPAPRCRRVGRRGVSPGRRGDRRHRSNRARRPARCARRPFRSLRRRSLVEVTSHREEQPAVLAAARWRAAATTWDEPWSTAASASSSSPVPSVIRSTSLPDDRP